ncbi:phosphopantetheine attachment site protein, partial [Klebsiella pneumoniae]|nr:phosphopantetheine attachment site protein [Klebsiella pneumoniae]
ASGERIYRTGDRGRYFADGQVAFLGRNDTQVKVNGYRIELGEIERCIARHPDVEQSVVVAVGNSQHRRLV